MKLFRLLNQSSPRQRWIASILLAIVVLGCLAAASQKRSTPPAEHAVTRGDFMASVTESGTLEPSQRTVLRSELDGSARIVYIVPEGTYAAEGDLLVELDASRIEDSLMRRELSHEKRVASLASAESRLLVVQSDAESDIRKAELAVKFAMMDLEKFEKLQKQQQIREGDIDIDTASQSLRIAKERLAWSRQLAENGYETKATLDRDRLAMVSESARLEKAQSEQRMLTRFDLLKREVKLRSDAAERRRKLLRVRKESESRVVKARAKLRSAQATFAISEEDVAQAKAQLNATKIYAPHEGLIVYAKARSRHSRESTIEEGATVRNRQNLIVIPNTSSMKMEIKVHESMASLVAVGQEVVVRLDSVSDRQFRGEVAKVAVFPDTQSFWGNPNLKVYATEIRILDQLEDINPGASAEAHIIVERRSDVVAVPLKAIATYKGHKVCHLKRGRQIHTVPVEVGVFNDDVILVNSGLKPGDVILADAKAGEFYELDPRLQLPPDTSKRTRLVADPRLDDDLG